MLSILSLPDRLQNKIIPEPMTGCWLWIGHINRDGYGRTVISKTNKLQSAHQATYRALVGEIPPGKELDHKCRVRSCCNPDHLEPVTHIENMRRGIQFAPATCRRGHKFIEGSFSIRRERNSPRQSKRCLLCRRDDYGRKANAT